MEKDKLKSILLVLYFLYFVTGCIYIYDHFSILDRKELSFFIVGSFLLLVSLILTIVSKMIFAFSLISKKYIYIFISIILFQTVTSLSSGAIDGIKRYKGIESLYLIDKNGCGGRIGSWIYLSKFRNETFFINLDDKSVCIMGNKDLLLGKKEN